MWKACQLVFMHHPFNSFNDFSQYQLLKTKKSIQSVQKLEETWGCIVETQQLQSQKCWVVHIPWHYLMAKRKLFVGVS